MKISFITITVLSLIFTFCIQVSAQVHSDQNGLKSSVVNDLVANNMQALRYEVATVGFNSYHWQPGGIIIVELFQQSFSTAYQKYIINNGFSAGINSGQTKLSLVESGGQEQHARVTIGTAYNLATSYGGYINKAFPIYIDVRYYAKYRVKITYQQERVDIIDYINQIKINTAPVPVEISDFSVPLLSDNSLTSTSNLMVTGEGVHYISKGNVGIGTVNPTSKLEVSDGDIAVSGNLLVSKGNITGGGIKLADDGDIVDLNDGWATHRFSNGIRINDANSGGAPVIQLSNSVNTPSFFSSSRLGIGTQNPAAALEVSGGAVFGGNIDPNSAIGNLGYLTGTGKMLIGFNRSGGRGEASFISNQGGGGSNGGFTFYNHNNQGAENELLTINGNGNIGIGTSSPSTALDVRGIISTPEIAFRNADGGDDSDPYRLRKVQGGPNTNWLELQLNDDETESFRIYGNSCVGYNCGNYSGNLYHSFDAMGNVYHKGNVGIGTTAPTEKLTVNGKIRAREIRVDALDMPDYVFEEDYKVGPLEELESYIKKNKHLPEIPSAIEAGKNGLELGEMNKLLLKKIEELTLYLIEEHKLNEKQGDLLDAQRLKINELEKTLKSFKK